MTCDHTTYRSHQTYNHYTDEYETEYYEMSTYEDINIGSCRCTKCGDIQYYTGHWKKYFEEGVPCPGSDSL